VIIRVESIDRNRLFVLLSPCAGESRSVRGCFMARVCFGEFDWPDERGKREFLQMLFLDTISKVDKAPLKQLYGKPFEMYRQCCKDFGLDYSDIYFRWRLTGAARSMVQALNAEIDAWSRTWNLDAKWCRQTALASLHAWSCSSREITELFFQHPGGGGGVPTSPDPPEGFPKYVAYMMSRDDYLEWVQSTALQVISDNSLLSHAPRIKAKAFAVSIAGKAMPYCRTVEAVYVETGWKRCRKNEKKSLKRHMEWTVKFQISGKTFNELAAEANVEQPTISRAVRDILSILPLDKRSDSRPGRIRGRKNKRSVEPATRVVDRARKP
jgi:hypothetical protein